MKSFADYGIIIPHGSVGEVYALCPECSHKRKKNKDKCLRVNATKQTWNCKHCGWAGGLGNKIEVIDVAPPVLRNTPTVDINATAESFLSERGISIETAKAFGIKSCVHFFPQTNGKEDALSIPFIKNEKEVNYKYRCTRQKAHSQSKGGEQCLYNYDAIDGFNEIVITEGEFDAMAVHESGFSCAVCSCPAGAAPIDAKNLDNKMTFLDDAKTALDNATSIIMATDNDEVGIVWRDRMIEKLGEWRCKTVSWPEGCKDANDVLIDHGADCLNECLKTARPVPVPGIIELNDIKPEIVEYYQNGGLGNGLTTGWRQMDEVLRMNTQSLNILTGIPMSGKSEWLDQLMLNMADLHKWKWAIYSPENHPVVTHVQKLAEKRVGKPMFDRWGGTPMKPEELKEATAWLSEHIKVLTFGEKPATVDSIINRLKACKERWGIKGVVIDPYNELDHCRPKSQTETEYVSDFLSRMRNFGRLHDMAIWIVAHPTKLQKYQQGEMEGEYPVPTPYDISGSAHWRNKADVCIAVWRSMKATDGVVDIHVQKVRNKNLGRTGSVQMQWDRATGTFDTMRDDLSGLD